MIRSKYILFIFILTVSLYANSTTSNGLPISDQDYITGEDGVIRMNVNILGHVKNPGTYLVYDGIDFISLLSLAGGPARGANLKNIKVINNNGSYSINLNKFLKNGKFDTSIEINPKTTVYIEEKVGSKMFRGTNLISSILQVLTLAVTIERTKD